MDKFSQDSSINGQDAHLTLMNNYANKLRKICWDSLALLATTMKNTVFDISKLPLEILEYFKEYFNYWKLARQFKGIMPLPILGNLPITVLMDPTFAGALDHFLSVMNKLRLGQIWVSVLRHIFISRSEDIEAFLSNSKNNTKGFVYGVVECPGLVTLSGPTWKRHRRIIQPSFHMQVLVTLIDIFDNHGHKFVQSLASKANGVPFNIEEDVHNISFQIIMDGVMDCGNIPKTTVFHQEIREMFICFGTRGISPWLYPRFTYHLSSIGRRELKARKVVEGFIKEVMEMKREAIRENSGESNDYNEKPRRERRSFLSHLVAEQMNGAPITDKEMVEDVIQFFMAGVDTSVSALQSALYHLSNNKHVQDKAMEELMDVFDDGTTITEEKLKRMTYIEMIVSETLRCSPPIWFISRTSGVDTPLPCGLVIPRGAQVAVSIKSLHMDPNTYPDPEVFDPERFSKERKSRIGPYDFIPFMKGSRNCIGHQYSYLLLKSVISLFIWNYEILPDPTYKPEYGWGVITYIANGTRIALRPRRRDT